MAVPTLKGIQEFVGARADGIWGRETALKIAAALKMPAAKPFDAAAWQRQFVNTNAPAITLDDMQLAADRLAHSVTLDHVRMVRTVESNGKSFDDKGRPVILPEPHIFYRLTGGAHGVSDISYPKWGTRPYPSSYDARWALLAKMAELDEEAAIQSASWGLFQVMGFHWKACGYQSPRQFAHAMAADEDNHLEAMVAFLRSEDLEDELAACRAGDPDSCRPFARGYNGPGYAKHGYHIKMAEALK